MVEQWVEISLGIAGWYLTSFGTLLLNKHLLGTLHIQPNTLAVIQMVSTAIYGALKTLTLSSLLRVGSDIREAWRSSTGAGPKGGTNGGSTDDLEDPESTKKGYSSSTWRRGLGQMGLVGAMRFSTVVLGLVSLKFVAASFTETIKASAPFFTVIIAYFMLGESTTPMVFLSLVPVAAGLVMVSYAELSFNMIGFSAAVATNIIECVQNVFSKRLLAREYTASQLQFYTSLTALCMQAPIFIFNLDLSGGPSPAAVVVNGTFANGTLAASDAGSVAELEPAAAGGFELTTGVLFLLWIDGVLYHLQSVVAYVVMSYLSPVTVSVVNTLKRAMAIWVSVLVFHNTVTPFAALGTAVCLLGALWYNWARQQQPAKPAENGGRSSSGDSSGRHLFKTRR